MLAWVNPWDWRHAAHYSIQVMTLLKPDDWVPLRYAQLIIEFCESKRKRLSYVA